MFHEQPAQTKTRGAEFFCPFLPGKWFCQTSRPWFLQSLKQHGRFFNMPFSFPLNAVCALLVVYLGRCRTLYLVLGDRGAQTVRFIFVSSSGSWYDNKRIYFPKIRKTRGWFCGHAFKRNQGSRFDEIVAGTLCFHDARRFWRRCDQNWGSRGRGLCPLVRTPERKIPSAVFVAEQKQKKCDIEFEIWRG